MQIRKCLSVLEVTFTWPSCGLKAQQLAGQGHWSPTDLPKGFLPSAIWKKVTLQIRNSILPHT